MLAASHPGEMAAICRPISDNGTRDRKNASRATASAMEAAAWKRRD